MSGEISERENESTNDQTESSVVDAPESELTDHEVAAVKQIAIETVRSEFSGPIPPPNIIKGYEQILPGSAERLIAMAERQAAHRQEMEKMMVKAESRDSLLGVCFAFLLGIGCLIGSAVMVINVPQSAGVIGGALLGVTGIGTITSNFIKSAKGIDTKDKNVKKRQGEESSENT